MTADDETRHDSPLSTGDIQRYKRNTSYIGLSVLAGTVTCMVLMLLTSPL